MIQSKSINLKAAQEQSVQIRKLYRQIEEKKHGQPWTTQEDMIGFLYDVGELARLLMASEGRRVHDGDVPKELANKVAECLWWICVLSDRTGIDLTQAFAAKMAELTTELSPIGRKKKRTAAD